MSKLMNVVIYRSLLKQMRRRLGLNTHSIFSIVTQKLVVCRYLEHTKTLSMRYASSNKVNEALDHTTL